MSSEELPSQYFLVLLEIIKEIVNSFNSDAFKTTDLIQF
jgi:hypothetical protein